MKISHARSYSICTSDLNICMYTMLIASYRQTDVHGYTYRRSGKFHHKKVTWDKSSMCFNFVKAESIVYTSTKELRY